MQVYAIDFEAGRAVVIYDRALTIDPNLRRGAQQRVEVTREQVAAEVFDPARYPNLLPARNDDDLHRLASLIDMAFICPDVRPAIQKRMREQRLSEPEARWMVLQCQSARRRFQEAGSASDPQYARFGAIARELNGPWPAEHAELYTCYASRWAQAQRFDAMASITPKSVDLDAFQIAPKSPRMLGFDPETNASIWETANSAMRAYEDYVRQRDAALRGQGPMPTDYDRFWRSYLNIGWTPPPGSAQVF